VYLLLLYICEKFIAFCGCTEWTWYTSSNAEAAGEPEGGGTEAPEWSQGTGNIQSLYSLALA
jgi:hypothetical protein